MDPDQVARNIDAQIQLYGEPLATSFGRLVQVFGLTQARLAGLLGLSAPMLSQLMSGQRVKIGNPAVVQRVQALADLAAGVETGQVAPDEIEGRLAEVRQSEAVLTTRSQPAQTDPGTNAGPTAHDADEADDEAYAAARSVARTLHSVATADDIAGAAARLDSSYPQLATVLRTYGLGSQDAAVQHYRAHWNDAGGGSPIR